jgi:hypothetical protein
MGKSRGGSAEDTYVTTDMRFRLADTDAAFTIITIVDYPYGFDCRALDLFGGPCIFQG